MDEYLFKHSGNYSLKVAKKIIWTILGKVCYLKQL